MDAHQENCQEGKLLNQLPVVILSSNIMQFVMLLAKKMYKPPITSFTCILVIDQHTTADLLRTHFSSCMNELLYPKGFLEFLQLCNLLWLTFYSPLTIATKCKYCKDKYQFSFLCFTFFHLFFLLIPYIPLQ